MLLSNVEQVETFQEWIYLLSCIKQLFKLHFIGIQTMVTAAILKLTQCDMQDIQDPPLPFMDRRLAVIVMFVNK